VESHFVRNFAVSIGAGALVFGTWAAAVYEPCASDCWLSPDDRADAFAFGAVIGAVVAIPVGVIAGIASRSERWEAIPLSPPADVTLLLGAPAGRGVSLGLRLPVGFE
jgi:hypothetical protein